MFIEIVNSISNVIGTVENDLVVFTKMIIIPALFMLRGVAFVGIAYPVFSYVGRLLDTDKEVGKSFILMLCWVCGNVAILSSPIIPQSLKWIWLDIVGASVGIYVFWRYSTREKTRNIYKTYNKNHH